MASLFLILVLTSSFCALSLAELTSCVSSIQHVVKEARLGKLWALNMLDSSIKVPDGILYGHIQHLGNYGQCIKINEDDTVLGAFQGRYCKATIEFDEGERLSDLSLLYGICIPSICKPEDVAPLLEEHVGPYLGIRMNVTQVQEDSCFIDEPARSLDSGSIVFITFTSVLLVLGMVCSWLDYHGKQSTVVNIFSLRSSSHRVFSTTREPGSLSCLHGLRVGSMLWVLCGHRFSQESQHPISNYSEVEDVRRVPLYQTIENAFLAVDTFFFLSGLLMCYSFMKSSERSSKFDLFKFYLYRYLRITVPLSFLIFFYTTMFIYLGSGPQWNAYVLGDVEACKLSWWTNLIYINNVHYPPTATRMCIGQSWYLAVDMQLAWLSPMLLLPLRHSPRAGVQLGALLLAVSCVIPFAVNYVCGFPMSLTVGPVNAEWEAGCDYSLQIYNAVQSRASPYICGILLGYYLFLTKSKKLNLQEWMVVFGWILCTLLCLTLIYTLSITYQEDYVYNRLGSAFYAGFHRLGWSLGLAWIVFACTKGYGGPIDSVLSWRGLLPLSRLTFCAYLGHMIIITSMAASQRASQYYSNLQATQTFLGDILPVFSIAIVVHLLVEAPNLVVLKLLFQSSGPRKKVTRQLC